MVKYYLKRFEVHRNEGKFPQNILHVMNCKGNCNITEKTNLKRHSFLICFNTRLNRYDFKGNNYIVFKRCNKWCVGVDDKRIKIMEEIPFKANWWHVTIK